MAKARGLERSFRRARIVRSSAITGAEEPEDIILGRFPAFVGRQERTAFELMRRSVDDDYVVFLTMSGSMTPAGLHTSCVVPLIERGMVDVLTTTGANLYHDVHRVIGHQIREIDPNAGDLALRLSRIVRIYDLGFSESALQQTDRLLSAILTKPQFQRTMTTPELHYLLGREVAALEDALGVAEPTLLATAYRHAVPVFVGAVQDGSIFQNIVQLKRLMPPGTFRLNVDVNDDVFAMGALQHFCGGRAGLNRRMAVWILGGGVPKSYTLQGEPLLGRILRVPASGFDIDVQLCVDPTDNGAPSSASAGEGHTWGNVSSEGVRTSVYCHSDVTSVLPWLTYALFRDQKRRRPQRRLMERLDQAVALLDRACRKSLKKLPRLPKALPKDVHQALAKPAAPRTSSAAPKRVTTPKAQPKTRAKTRAKTQAKTKTKTKAKTKKPAKRP